MSFYATIKPRLSLESWKLGEGGEQMDKHNIADNICRLCREKNVSVEALAESIGKSPRQVNRYRNGQCENIPIETLSAIADTLDTTIADLLS